MRRLGAKECPALRTKGICFEGLACRHLHVGAQAARVEACPYGVEVRDRCPLRHFCAFSHGPEQKRPPMIRARQGNASLPSFSSLPVAWASPASKC